jgi:ABC-type transport system involved in multi-copper enzyme maturation permease subunit
MWELQEYWDFPILEIAAATALFSILNWSYALIYPETRYQILGVMIVGPTTFPVTFSLCLIVGAILSHTFAGSLSKEETKMLLSYPVKKWWLLLSKYVTNLFVFFIIYTAAISINIPLLSLSPLEPMLYVTLVSVFIQLLFMCSIVMFISLVLKNEVASVLASIFLLLSMEIYGTNQNNLLSFSIRYGMIFRFFEQIFHNVTTEVVLQDVLTAIAFPVLVSGLLVALSFLYFNHIMEFD